MLTLALKGEAKQVPQLYEDYCQKIERGQFPVEILAKTETLQDTLDAYQQKIAKSDLRMPILFMTAHGDIEMTVKATKAGALDFFSKPFRSLCCKAYPHPSVISTVRAFIKVARANG